MFWFNLYLPLRFVLNDFQHEIKTEPKDSPADVTHTSISHISLYLSQNYQITTLAHASFQLTYMFVSELGHCLFRILA